MGAKITALPALVLTIVTLMACGASEPENLYKKLPGIYTLTAFQGHPLPYKGITSGWLNLNENRTWASKVEYDYGSGSGSAGDWTVLGRDSLVLTVPGSPGAIGRVGVHGTKLMVRWAPSADYEYVRADE